MMVYALTFLLVTISKSKLVELQNKPLNEPDKTIFLNCCPCLNGLVKFVFGLIWSSLNLNLELIYCLEIYLNKFHKINNHRIM